MEGGGIRTPFQEKHRPKIFLKKINMRTPRGRGRSSIPIIRSLIILKLDNLGLEGY